MTQTRYYSSSAKKTILQSPVDAGDTILLVLTISDYPLNYPYTLILDRDTLDEEVVEATASTGTSFTVTRGVDGTTAVAHSSGATVEHGTSARDFKESDQHRSTSENVHGIQLGSLVVGTTDAQTLTNKTLGSHLAAGGFKVTGLANPTNAQDAATKNWAETGLTSQLVLATTQATNSLNSATASSTSATASGVSAAASQSSRLASEAARNAALASQTSATASQSASATSASNAATSASAASGSAATASTQAGIATTQSGVSTAQAVISTTQATNSATSASSSSGSAASAASSATASQTSRLASETARNAALVSQTSATASQSSATASATTATTQAGISTTQSGVSTTQAGISTAQAVLAATQAGNSAASATASSGSATSSSNSAAASSVSASAALVSENAAAASFDNFDDRYLGSKSSAPTVDNDGNALITGALYFNSTEGTMYVRTAGATWATLATAVPTSITANTTTPALRVTQTGTGNALLVEDSTNPDATPFVVDANGNVGVGTTTPVGLLDAYKATGDAVIQLQGDSTAYYVARQAVTSTAGPLIILDKARGTIASPAIVSNGDTSGVVRFRGHDGTAYRNLAQIEAAVDGTPGSTDMPGRLVFSTTADGASAVTERMRITSAGNVGINTSSPSELLVVNGGNISLTRSAVHSQMQFSRENAASTIVVDGNVLGDIIFRGYDGATNQVASRIRGQVNGTPGASDMPGALGFWTTADGGITEFERMRITQAGNVGIGTTAPNFKLAIFDPTSTNVVAAAFVSETPVSGTGSTSLRLTKGSGLGVAAYGADVCGYMTPGVGAGLTLNTVNAGTSTERVRIDHTGNVGIGTSSPAQKLHVSNASATTIIQVDSGSVTQYSAYAANVGGIAYTGTGSDHPLGTLVNNSERLRINNAGLITGTGTSLGAWTAYTPTLAGTGWTLGNGTVSGAYCQIGKIVHYYALITLGSTSTAGAGGLIVSVPVTANSTQPNPNVQVQVFDASLTSRYLGSGNWGSTTSVVPTSIGASGAMAALTTSAPFTWATSDTIQICGTYQAS